MSAESNQFELPNHLEDELRDGNVVPFVGAGVSMAVKDEKGEALFPGWRELLQRAAGRIREVKNNKENKADLIEAAIAPGNDQFQLAANQAKDTLAEDWPSFFRDCFDPDPSQVNEDTLELPRLLWEIGDDLVVTTNYDHVLKWANPHHRTVKQWGPGDASEFGPYFSGKLEGPILWHLHGFVDRMDSIILTPEAYDELYSTDEDSQIEALESARQALNQHFLQKTLLFVGFSFSDEEFGAQMQYIDRLFAGNAGRHYALLQQDEVGKASEPVHPIPYQEHGEPLLRIVRDMAETAEDSDHDTRRESMALIRGTDVVREDASSADEVEEYPVTPNYVEREELKAVFETVIERGEPRMLAIWGMGGAGKTTFLRNQHRECKNTEGIESVFIDLEDLSTVRALAEQLGDEVNEFLSDDIQKETRKLTKTVAGVIEGLFSDDPPIRKRIRDEYREIFEPVVGDLPRTTDIEGIEEPSGDGNPYRMEKSDGSSDDEIDGGHGSTAEQRSELASRPQEERHLLSGEKKKEKRKQVLDRFAQRLAETWKVDLDDRPTCFIFDTLELLTDQQTKQWLLTDLIPALRKQLDGSAFIVAGQKSATEFSELPAQERGRYTTKELQSFDLNKTTRYLQKAGIEDEDFIETLHRLSDGLPLLLSSVVSFQNERGEELEREELKKVVEKEETVRKSFLYNHIIERLPEDLQSTIQRGAILRRYDKRLLEVVLNQDEVSADTMEQLARWPFVEAARETGADRRTKRFHEVVQRLQKRDIQETFGLEMVKTLHERAAQELARRVKQHVNKEEVVDLSLVIKDALYHFIEAEKYDALESFLLVVISEGVSRSSEESINLCLDCLNIVEDRLPKKLVRTLRQGCEGLLNEEYREALPMLEQLLQHQGVRRTVRDQILRVFGLLAKVESEHWHESEHWQKKACDFLKERLDGHDPSADATEEEHKIRHVLAQVQHAVEIDGWEENIEAVLKNGDLAAVKAHITLARWAYEEDQQDKVESHLRDARSKARALIGRKPKLSAFESIGDAYRQLLEDREEMAVTCYGKALDEDHMNFSVRKKIAEAQREMGDWDEAATEYNRIADLHKEEKANVARANEALCRVFGGHLSDVYRLQDMAESREVDPDVVHPFVALLETHGYWMAAANTLKQLGDTSGQNYEIKIAFLKGRAGRMEKALDTLSLYARRGSDKAEERLKSLALACEDENRWDDAIHTHEVIRSRFPHLRDMAHMRITLCKVMDNRVDDAFEDINDIERQDPELATDVAGKAALKAMGRRNWDVAIRFRDREVHLTTDAEKEEVAGAHSVVCKCLSDDADVSVVDAVEQVAELIKKEHPDGLFLANTLNRELRRQERWDENVSALDEITSALSESEGRLKARVQAALCAYYAEHDDFEDRLEEIVDKDCKKAAEAIIGPIAISYEKEGKWEKAARAHSVVAERCPELRGSALGQEVIAWTSAGEIDCISDTLFDLFLEDESLGKHALKEVVSVLRQDSQYELARDLLSKVTDWIDTEEVLERRYIHELRVAALEFEAQSGSVEEGLQKLQELPETIDANHKSREHLHRDILQAFGRLRKSFEQSERWEDTILVLDATPEFVDDVSDSDELEESFEDQIDIQRAVIRGKSGDINGCIRSLKQLMDGSSSSEEGLKDGVQNALEEVAEHYEERDYAKAARIWSVVGDITEGDQAVRAKVHSAYCQGRAGDFEHAYRTLEKHKDEGHSSAIIAHTDLLHRQDQYAVAAGEIAKYLEYQTSEDHAEVFIHALTCTTLGAEFGNENGTVDADTAEVWCEELRERIPNSPRALLSQVRHYERTEQTKLAAVSGVALDRSLLHYRDFEDPSTHGDNLDDFTRVFELTRNELKKGNFKRTLDHVRKYSEEHLRDPRTRLLLAWIDYFRDDLQRMNEKLDILEDEGINIEPSSFLLWKHDIRVAAKRVAYDIDLTDLMNRLEQLETS